MESKFDVCEWEEKMGTQGAVSNQRYNTLLFLLLLWFNHVLPAEVLFRHTIDVSIKIPL
jgi:hypothetical protein